MVYRMIIARGMILLPIMIEHSALNRKGVKNRMIMGERCQVARDDCAIFLRKMRSDLEPFRISKITVRRQGELPLPWQLTFSHLNMDGWNTIRLPFGAWPIFRGYVSCRAGNGVHDSSGAPIPGGLDSFGRCYISKCRDFSATKIPSNRWGKPSVSWYFGGVTWSKTKGFCWIKWMRYVILSKDVTIMYCCVLACSPPSNIPGCQWQMKVQ